jgi:hypothetical protein
MRIARLQGSPAEVSEIFASDSPDKWLVIYDKHC